MVEQLDPGPEAHFTLCDDRIHRRNLCPDFLNGENVGNGHPLSAYADARTFHRSRERMMSLSIVHEFQGAVLLCFDDDEAILECEKSFLERFGYTVLTAASGGKGLELASTYSVDVVIVDYFMPLGTVNAARGHFQIGCG
jgi:hypothetical protein